MLSPSGAPLEVPPKRVVGRSCCRGAYLRGALLGAGSLSGPRDPHLEIRTGTLDAARFVQDVAQRADAKLAVAERRGHALAYAKGHDAIGTVLAIAGAGDTALVLEEHAILSSLRADANRLANADEANLERVARAAHRQLEAIRAIGLDALPARARRDRRAAAAPPVGVARRARREGASAADEVGRAPQAASGNETRRNLAVAAVANPLALQMRRRPYSSVAEPGLGRRWIQTPSTVVAVSRSTGGRVVLGASPRAASCGESSRPLIYVPLDEPGGVRRPAAASRGDRGSRGRPRRSSAGTSR